MSEDEIFLFIVSVIVCLIGWGGWLYSLVSAPVFAFGRTRRSVLLLVPLVATALLLAVLRFFASSDVQTAPVYLGLYTVFGLAWTSLSLAIVKPVTGLYPLVDSIGHRNDAALWPTAGAIIGAMLCFAGGNIGDGPGWWVVLYAAALSTGTWLACWALLNVSVNLHERITVERDVAVGVRLCGGLIGTGLIFGRGVAGDWQGGLDLITEFYITTLPGLGLLGAQFVVEMMIGARRGHALLSGVPFALAYIGTGVWFLFHAGWWE